MADSEQYVTLGLDREIFAIPVGKVREILEMRSISRLPHAPDYLLGIIDVRGCSVPVIDLRLKLGLPPVEATVATRILVLEVTVGDRGLVLGLMVDKVFEVTALDGDTMDPPPDIGTRWRSDYITAVGRRGEAFVVVFDLSKLFTATELPLLAGADAGVAA
jgi:purine-binding chemotaxis protein CheW